MQGKGREYSLQDNIFVSANAKKLTKKQEDAKKKAQQREQLRRQAHLMNTTEDQFDLLSKNRDKKTDCQSKMIVKIFTKRAINEMCEVELWWNHNHSVNSFHRQSFCPILPSTKATFENYFEMGMSASQAFHVSIMLLADRKYCPSLTDVKNMYGKLTERAPLMDKKCLTLLKLLLMSIIRKILPKEGNAFCKHMKTLATQRSC